jgi:probable HAF family extracellular repeat protein
MKVAKKGSYAVKLPSLGWSARPEGINERGQLVGYADADASGATRAVLWNTGKKGNTIKDLGTLGGANSAAVDVNNAGQVVGWSERAGGDHQSYAFLWNPGKNGNGTMIDLNTLLPKGSPLTLMFANGINDAGEIVCHAEDANHADHTVLIRPAGVKQGGAVVAPASAGAAPAVFSGVKIEEEAGVWA